MTYFDLAMLIGIAGVIGAALIGTVSVAASFRNRGFAVASDADCREAALIMHGEGARADCN